MTERFICKNCGKKSWNCLKFVVYEYRNRSNLKKRTVAWTTFCKEKCLIDYFKVKLKEGLK